MTPFPELALRLRSALRERFEILCRLLPAGVLLAGLFLGMFPFLPDFAAHAWMIAGLSLLLIVCSFRFFPLRSAISLAVAAGIGCIAIHVLSPLRLSRTGSDTIRGTGCAADIRVEVVDPKCPACDRIDWLPNPRFIRGKVRAFRYGTGDRFRPVDFTVMLSFPSHWGKIRYGDMLTVQGFFERPETQSAPELGFDFRRHLQIQGVDFLFRARNIIDEPVFDHPSRYTTIAWKKLLSFRDRALEAAVSGISRNEDRTLIAALLFGCRQGLDPSDRRSYVRSGTVHLFAVSGLHIGLIALVLFVSLRWIPFRTRHILVPLLLTGYVMTIGFQASAVRALLMIAIWSFCRAFLRASHPLNAVFLAACCILLVRPWSWIEPGFQYSFLVTFFLILSWNKIRSWLDALFESSRWRPPSETTTARRILRHAYTAMFATLFSTLVACMAGGVLTLCHQGMAIPGAVIANFLIQPVVWLFFVFGTCRAFLGMFGLAFVVPAILMEAPILAFQHLISLTEGCLPIRFAPSPSPIAIAGFFAFLAIALHVKNRTLSKMAITGIVALPLYWLSPDFNERTRVWIFHGGESPVASVLISPAGRQDAVLVDTPSRTASLHVSKILETKGLERLRLILIRRAVKDHLQGLPQLLSGTPVDRIAIPPSTRSSYAKAGIAACGKTGTVVVPYVRAEENDTADLSTATILYKEPGISMETRADCGFALTIGFHEIDSTRIEAHPLESGATLIRIKPANGEGVREMELARCSRTSCVRTEF